MGHVTGRASLSSCWLPPSTLGQSQLFRYNVNVPCGCGLTIPVPWSTLTRFVASRRVSLPTSSGKGLDGESGTNNDDQSDDDQPSDGQSPDGKDWDASWTEFSKQRTGGTFELPKEENVEDPSQERVDRLTSAWSNESGFLVGIAVILLIAAFYAYVYETGGISH